MHGMKVLPALAVLGAQGAFAQRSSNNDEACTTGTYTITEAAQATIDCSEMEGTLEISSDVSGEVEISGPATIKGGLSISNATDLISLSSSSLQTIEGKFEMIGLTRLSSISMTDLTTIGEIEWIHLPAFNALTLGTAGITSAEKVTISDTDLRSLDDLKIASVSYMDINNNPGLTSYSTQLANITEELKMQSNGQGLNVTLSNLIWANSLNILDAASVLVPSLEYVNTSLRFDQNSFKSFAAPNLTSVGSDDISFINNDQLTNLSFPLLEEIGGSLTIVNNTKLEKVDGFPELETIGGAVLMGGNFTEVEIPSLDTASGAFKILSTDDISDSCSSFDDMEGSQIRGEYTCRGEDETANEGADSNGTSNGGSNNDDDSGSSMLSMNIATVLGVAAIGASLIV